MSSTASTEEQYFPIRPIEGHDEQSFLVFGSAHRADRLVGIYAQGGCDIPSIFAVKPFIERIFDGTCCVLRDGIASGGRSDILLQTLEMLPGNVTDEVINIMGIQPGYFKPKLFSNTFTIRRNDKVLEFPKNAVILSIAPDIGRVAYRHKRHSLIVDPGSAWLEKAVDRFLSKLSAAEWFRNNFTSIGLMSVETSMKNFSRIIDEVRSRTNAQVLIMNVLGPEPRGEVHTYQLVRDPMVSRRREFSIALTELSKRKDFSIIDLNRTYQRAGIADHLDWMHPHPSKHSAVGGELFRILREIGVLGV